MIIITNICVQNKNINNCIVMNIWDIFMLTSHSLCISNLNLIGHTIFHLLIFFKVLLRFNSHTIHLFLVCNSMISSVFTEF